MLLRDKISITREKPGDVEEAKRKRRHVSQGGRGLMGGNRVSSCGWCWMKVDAFQESVNAGPDTTEHSFPISHETAHEMMKGGAVQRTRAPEGPDAVPTVNAG